MARREWRGLELVPCSAVLYLDGQTVAVQGLTGDMASRYTFIDLPGQHVAAIWSWTRGDRSLLERNQRLVNGIRFDTLGPP